MSNKLSLLVNFVGVDKMSTSLRNIIGLGDKGSKSLNELIGSGRKLEKQLKDVQRELAGSSGNVTALIDRERDLEAQIAETNQQLERRKRLNVIEASQKSMTRRGEDLRARGQDHVTQGVGLAAPLIAATVAAAQFSSGMVDIQQKADLSDAAADRLSRRIVLMADRAKQMPEDVRSGLDILLAKGMGLKEAEAAIGPAGRLATAYKVAIPDAADAANSSINNLKISASQTGKIFDAMAAAGNAGGFEVRDMARHFPALTAQFAALGATGVPAVADLSAALQVAMHTAGGADEAANNIQNLLGKINAPGTISAFRKNFGVDLPAAMKKLEDQGYSSLEAIALVTQQATGGDMKKLGFAFEDQQVRMGILAMIQNLEEYRKIRAAAMNSGGTVDRAFDQRTARDAMVMWTQLKSSTSQVAITLGTTLLPVASQVMTMIGGAASGVAQWAQANPELAATLTQAAAGLIAFKLGIGASMMALGTIIGPFSTVISIVRKFGLAGQAFKLVAGGARMLIPLLAGISLPMLAIGAAIGVVAYLVYKNWDTINAAFWKGVAWIKNTLGGMPEWFKAIGRDMMAGLLSFLTPGAFTSRLMAIAKSGVTAFKNFFGIKSPSRLFMAMGGHMTEGLSRGIDHGGRVPLASMGKLAAGIGAAGAIALSPAAASPFDAKPGAGGVAASIGAAASPVGAASPVATASPARPAPAARAAPNISVTIQITQQPGQSARDLAVEVRRELEKLNATAARGAYVDRGD